MTPRGRHPGRRMTFAAAVDLAAAVAIALALGCGSDERATERPAQSPTSGGPSTSAHAGAGDEDRPSRSQGPVSSWSYVATPDAELAGLTVRACFEGTPDALEPNGDAALRFLRPDGLDGLELEDGRMEVEELDAEGCVRYAVDLSVATDFDHPLAARREGTVLLGAPLWLWGPVPRADGAQGTLRFTGDVPVLLPWDRRDGKHVLSPVSFEFDAPVVLGDAAASSRMLSIDGTELRVARMGRPETISDQALDDWLGANLDAVASLFGEPPVPRATVVVVPVDSVDRPVACGHTYRGGGAAVVLRVRRGVEAEALRTDDWVTVHEMTHLGLPYVRHSDAWLSEGLATYYQEILRARVGMQSAREAWARIHDGFERAREETTDRPLAEASAEMHATHGFERVYWSGAAIALLADVEMRRRGLGTLDEAVRELRSCCAWPPRAWSAEEIVARIDETSGEPVFGDLADRWLSSTEFPEVQEAFRWLGVRPRGDSVRLVRRAPGAEVREAITSRGD